MGTITRHPDAPFQDGEVLTGPDLEADFATIYDEFNGNIDDANLADGAVTTSKLDDGAVTQDKMTSGAASTSSAYREIGAVGFAFSTTYIDLGDEISLTIGDPARHVAIFVSFLLATSADPTTINLKVLKDGVDLYTPFFTDQDFIPTQTGTAFQLVTRMYLDTAPTPGATHAYQVQIKSTAGACGAFNTQIFALEPRS